MTSTNGAPDWRPLTAVAALVVAAHALVLNASPAHLGAGLDPDNAVGKILTTRSIEAAPAPTQAAPALPKAVAAPKSVKTAKNTPKNPSNQPLDQQLPAQAAPEIIATTEPQPASLPIVEAPVETAAAATPTQTDIMLPVGPKTTPVTAISLPGSVRLLYDVVGSTKYLTYIAEAELTWKTDGDSYDVLMKVSARGWGSRSFISSGRITSGGLAPIRYAEINKTEVAAHFETDKGKITFSANTPDAPWFEGAQDRASVFLQLSGMLAAKPIDFPVGSSITLYTIGPRNAEPWTFLVESEELLYLPRGQMATLKVTRKPRHEFDQKIEIWFAPSLGYLPVRNIVSDQKGNSVDQQFIKIAK